MALTLPHGFKRWPDLADVHAQQVLLAQEWRGQQAFQNHWIQHTRTPRMAGFCIACASEREFTVDLVEGQTPNWRESMTCSGCGLINRWRASLHVAALLEAVRPPGPIYLTEGTTPLHRWLADRIPGLIASEFVKPGLRSGDVVQWQGQSVRHEDITRLSMADASLSMIQTYDVLEHVPAYREAIAEFARTLMPGGILLLTAPFLAESRDTVTRARLLPDGSIEHLLPPMYHGDPMSDQGILCFHEFGWDLLNAMREAGFERTEVWTCWAPDFGYLGSFQPFVIAWR